MIHVSPEHRSSHDRAISTRRGVQARPPVLAAAIWLGVLVGNAGAEDFSWEWTPTHLAVSILLEPDPELSPALSRRVGAAVRERIVAQFGAAVRCSIVDLPPDATFRCLRTVTKGTPPVVALRSSNPTSHKHCFVRLARGATGFTIEGREWDVELGVLGPPTRQAVGHVGLLPWGAAAAVASGFRPQLRVVELRQNAAVLRVRGGSLFPPGLIARLLPSGEGLLPVLRKRQADGSLQVGTAVPWTLFTVRHVVGPVVEATVVSGLRNPLGGRNRSRTEQWAVAAGRSDEATQLTIVGQSKEEPLPDSRVFLADVDASPKLLGTTDARGRITIPPAPGRVRMVLVTTRYLPLARFPLVTGTVPQTTALVPGSAKLLATEAWLADWQSRFTDVYIQRRVLATLASARIEQGAFDSARALLEASEKMESPRLHIEALELRRRTTRGDEPLESRLLEQLFDGSLDVVRKLDDSAVQAELRNRLASSTKKSVEGAAP